MLLSLSHYNIADCLHFIFPPAIRTNQLHKCLAITFSEPSVYAMPFVGHLFTSICRSETKKCIFNLHIIRSTMFCERNQKHENDDAVIFLNQKILSNAKEDTHVDEQKTYIRWITQWCGQHLRFTGLKTCWNEKTKNVFRIFQWLISNIQLWLLFHRSNNNKCFPKLTKKKKKNHRTIACIAYMLMNGWEPRCCAATCSAQMD